MTKDVAVGYCRCGCGQKTAIAKKTRTAMGHQKGEPLNYLNGHNYYSNKKGPDRPNWRGGRHQHQKGYIDIWKPEHKRSCNGYVKEHIFIAEKVNGKPLPRLAVIHHFNGDNSDNRNRNLVICENEKYHNLLHMRTKALHASGNARFLKCKYCNEYDDPANLHITPDTYTRYHKKCL